MVWADFRYQTQYRRSKPRSPSLHAKSSHIGTRGFYIPIFAPAHHSPSFGVFVDYSAAASSAFSSGLCLEISWRRGPGFAPTNSSTLSPFLKIMKVGMARIPYSWLNSGRSSTSTLAKWIEGFSRAHLHCAQRLVSTYHHRCAEPREETYWEILGAIALQGPHQVANQSTKTTSFLAKLSLKPSTLF